MSEALDKMSEALDKKIRDHQDEHCLGTYEETTYAVAYQLLGQVEQLEAEKAELGNDVARAKARADDFEGNCINLESRLASEHAARVEAETQLAQALAAPKHEEKK